MDTDCKEKISGTTDHRNNFAKVNDTGWRPSFFFVCSKKHKYFPLYVPARAQKRLYRKYRNPIRHAFAPIQFSSDGGRLLFNLHKWRGPEVLSPPSSSNTHVHDPLVSTATVGSSLRLQTHTLHPDLLQVSAGRPKPGLHAAHRGEAAAGVVQRAGAPLSGAHPGVSATAAVLSAVSV